MESPFTSPVAPPENEKPLFNKFLERGREGKNDWWRYMVGIIIVFALYLLGQLPFQFYALQSALKHGHTIGEIFENQQLILDPAFTHVNTNLALALELLIFFFSMGGLWIAVRFLHKKKFLSIITASIKFRYKRFFIGFVIWLVLNLLLLAFSYYSSPSSFEFVFQPGPFFGTLLICLFMLPVQTWWEEFFLRGYALQGLGLVFKRAIWPVLITSVCFGLLHMANKEVDCYGVAAMLPQYILPGLLFGVLASLDEGLELAMGLHLSNNLFGLVTVTSPCTAVNANAIWSVNDLNDAGSLLSAIVLHIVVFGLLWLIYRWDFKKLFRPY